MDITEAEKYSKEYDQSTSELQHTPEVKLKTSTDLKTIQKQSQSK